MSKPLSLPSLPPLPTPTAFRAEQRTPKSLAPVNAPEHAALTDKIAALRPQVMKVARGLTGNMSDADDLTQNALVRALEKQDRYVDGNLGGWLATLCRWQFYSDVQTINSGSVVIKATPMDPAVLAAIAGSSEPNQEHWVHLVEVVRSMSGPEQDELFAKAEPKRYKPRVPKPCKKCGTTLRYVSRHCVECKRQKDLRTNHAA